jgi:hypothetical protein
LAFPLFVASLKSNLKTLSVKYLLKFSCAETVIATINKMNEMIVLIAIFLPELCKAKNIH